MSNEKNMVLVTGATGNVGRQVVFQLLGMGARVRALSRGVYFEDPNGHLLEIITRPYGATGKESIR